MTKLFINIQQLVNVRDQNQLLRGEQLANLPIIENAYLLVEDGKIIDYGLMEDLGIDDQVKHPNLIDVKGQTIIPTWCDSHTHTVFAGSRENEFVYKIKGMGYAEIAAKGGGIVSSAQKIKDTSEEDLYTISLKKIEQLIAWGTGALEIKSGYGLSVEGELKMLRVIKKLKENVAIPIKASFLGAHTFPPEYKSNPNEYIRLIIEEMLPVIAKENLADYIDVFCEEGFYSVEQTKQILEAGAQYGLKAKIHANQLHASGGVELGVEMNAISVDHLETMSESAFKALEGSDTIATLLPTAAFYLRMPLQPARELIQRNAAVALATDFNPGSSPSGNMNFVLSLSCIQMKMLPEEAINAMTLNGAYAMELENEVGSITKGKRANFILTKPIPSLAYLPYAFGENLIDKVFINGTVFKGNSLF